MPPEWTPKRFISVEIEVSFDEPPLLKKKPGPPSGFRWQGEDYRVVAVHAHWFDFDRKGDMAKNMQPEHLRVASTRGSWGVGRYYFRAETDSGRTFDLYYDRAPEDAADRSGHWYLWREVESAGG
ncbi:MAG: DUF6504 family protein [Anaerolineales bacterium]